MEGAHQLVLALHGPGYTSYNVAIYNSIIQNFFEESIDFVGAHYTLNTRSEPFWCKARDQLKKSKRQIFYSEMIKNPSHYTKNNYVSYSFFKKNNWFTWLKQQ